MANDQNPERVVQAEIRDRFREDLSPTPLDVEAIRARLDATSPSMQVDVHVGASTLRATAETTDRSGFVGAVTDLVGAVVGETGPLRLTFADDEDGQDATFALHAANDLRRLLDENERIRAMTKLHRESTARQRHNLEQKLIGWREAAEQAARERDERPSRRDLLIAEERMRGAEEGRHRADRQIRVHLDIARAAERERDAAKARVSELEELKCEVCGRRVAHLNYAGHVIGWGCADADECKAAPEMPRPPAEEAPLADRVAALRAELDAMEARHGRNPTETGREYAQRMGTEFRSNMARLKSWDEAESERPRLAAQPGAGDTETPGTGSGRGTGVAEAPGTARAGEAWIPSFYGSECPHRPEWTCPEHDECRACECDCNTYVADLEEPDLTLIPGDMVVRDPQICSGRPTMRGTRILASRIAGELAAGTSWETLREWYPSLPSLPVPSTEENL